MNNCTDPNGGWALGCRIDGGQAEYVRVPYADQGLGLQHIFDLTDLDLLWEFYSTVNVHPKNVEMHRICSAGIMKYIRFLNDGR